MAHTHTQTYTAQGNNDLSPLCQYRFAPAPASELRLRLRVCLRLQCDVKNNRQTALLPQLQLHTASGSGIVAVGTATMVHACSVCCVCCRVVHMCYLSCVTHSHCTRAPRQSLPTLPPGASTQVAVELLPVEAGLHDISGIVVVDTATRKEFSAPRVTGVLVCS